MRGIVALLTLASVGSLCAQTSLADNCPSPSAPIDFPDPAIATEQDIVAAQQSVKQYLTGMESVLKCVTIAHNDLRHDKVVDDMQKTAARYNTVLLAFRARKTA